MQFTLLFFLLDQKRRPKMIHEISRIIVWEAELYILILCVS